MRSTPKTQDEVRRWLMSIVYAKTAEYRRKLLRVTHHEELTLNTDNDDKNEPVKRLLSRASNEEFAEVEINMFLEVLPPKERFIITELVMNGKSEKELAREMKVSQQTVNRIKRRAILQLRREIGE